MWEGLVGSESGIRDSARSAGDLSARQVYMGGPPAMIDAMVRLLLKSRVKRSQIRFDKFA